MKKLFPMMLLLAVAACSKGNSTPTAPSTTAAPYSQTDLVVGTGATAAAGNNVTVAYIGMAARFGQGERQGDAIR